MGISKKTSRKAHEIEEAIVFLVTQMSESGHNSKPFNKPVILHSIRVGLSLYNLNYEHDIVIAGILHDLIEHSDTGPVEIAEQFGEKVTQLVQANTFDCTVGSRTQQGIECIERCSKFGREALIVRAADTLENGCYVVNMPFDENFPKFWKDEIRYLVEVSQPILADEPIWQELNQQYRQVQTLI